MEKFAVDLDKVLDDFEFNEDCAEQKASVAYPRNAVTSTTKCTAGTSNSKNYNSHGIQPTKANKGHEIMPPCERNVDTQKVNIDSRPVLPENVAVTESYCKRDSVLEKLDPVNHFYSQECSSDCKITQKQCVQPQESGQVPVTIYNDISQKFLQKQQNEKTQNTYDKKLNQPNIKPSVSNVFSSLNEYINAPTVSLNYVDATLDIEDGRINKQTNSRTDGFETSSKYVTVVKDCNVVKNIPVDNRVSAWNEEISETNYVPHNTNYQNVLIHGTLGSYKSDLKEKNIDKAYPQSTPSSIVIENREKCEKTVALSELKHTYENVTTGSGEASTVVSNLDMKSKFKKDNEVKHVYENVNIGADTVQPVYENFLIGVKNSLSEPKAGSSTEIPEVCLFKKTAQKPASFANIDDLSEEELNKYLAELEEEERMNEATTPYQNVPLPQSCKNKIENGGHGSFQCQQDDEDANEAPIFESVMIGELPKVSEKELQEKAKKFPVIDYGAGFAGGETASNFLEKENLDALQDTINVTTVGGGDKIKDETCNRVDVPQTVDDNASTVQSSDVDKSGDIRNGEDTHVVDLNEERLQISNIVMETKKDSMSHVEYEENNPEANLAETLSNATCEEKENLMSHKDSIFQPDGFCIEEGVSNLELPIGDSEKQSEINVETDKPVRPQTLDIVLPAGMDEHQASITSAAQERSGTEGSQDNCQEPSPDVSDNSLIESSIILGKQPPFWIPDSDAPSCMLCDVKFTVLKRRHHCRACGKVLCNKCCNMKFRLEYQGNIDSRVCVPCYQLLIKADADQGMGDWSSGYVTNASSSDINSPQGRQPNPNNPMEYCSTIPPLQQLAGGLPPPPTVMVPVGVLKREGSTKQRPEGSKSVMFSDGIRPGCDLTELDNSWDLKTSYRKSGGKRVPTPGSHLPASRSKRQNQLPLDANTNSYIPQEPNSLPPTVTIHKGQVSYHKVVDQSLLYKTLKNECEPPVMFAVNRNLYAYVKITNLNCCVNKICWNITSRGLACVGQDEVILLVETLPDETQIPKDLLIYINQIYMEALKGNTITELGFSIFQGGNLLGSREHAGFLFIRQTLQCLQKIVLPPAPFLVGLLVHRWETPWAKVFPLRLLLRLGAEYRYYPCPLVSVRFRNALYFEIGHTVMKVLADFRNFGYTLPAVRGLTIHLKNRTTDVMFPKNRYDQVIKGLNNSNDHVLAYASNFSIAADSHLVCIQASSGDESSYQTQAINIHNKPRTVTGASFIVINGALKSSMGLSAKSSIVEDGLMVEIMPEKMEALKAALKNMQDFSIGCGKQGAPEPDETVNIKWVDNDTQFNLGVKSPIDGQLMDGIPSIRVHNGMDYKGTSRIIRWSEVFIIKSDDHPSGVHDPVDINKLSESIARATCAALVKLLDLLATAGLTKLGVRTTIHPDNVGYEAGSEGTKLPPIYMNSLDNELIQVLHKAVQNSQDTHTVLELIFYILDD